jgi:hypothetical protein
MTVNFDVNKIRYIIRGEINGSARFMALLLCAAAALLGAFWLSGMARSASSGLALSQSRYAELSRLADEFRAIAPTSAPGGDIDVMMTFAQVSARIELGGRVSRITPTPDGRRCFVEINRMYAEELTEMVRELEIRGIDVISAEIFTIPAGDERLFRVSMTIGTDA